MRTGWGHRLATPDKAVVLITVTVSSWQVGFTLLGYIWGSAIAGSYVRAIFNFLRGLHTVSQSVLWIAGADCFKFFPWWFILSLSWKQTTFPKLTLFPPCKLEPIHLNLWLFLGGSKKYVIWSNDQVSFILIRICSCHRLGRPFSLSPCPFSCTPGLFLGLYSASCMLYVSHVTSLVDHKSLGPTDALVLFLGVVSANFRVGTFSPGLESISRLMQELSGSLPHVCPCLFGWVTSLSDVFSCPHMAFACLWSVLFMGICSLSFGSTGSSLGPRTSSVLRRLSADPSYHNVFLLKSDFC